jgi:hypothetical protein
MTNFTWKFSLIGTSGNSRSVLAVLLAGRVDCATFYGLTMGKDTETVTPAALSVKAKSAMQRP